MINVYIILLITGMLIFSALPSILGYNDEMSFNNYYRYMVSFFSIYIIFKNIYTRKSNIIPKEIRLLYIF